MKKFILVLVFGLLLSFYTSVHAEDPVAGHKCSSTKQCLSCNVGESGCIKGVCTAFTCDSGDDDTAPDKPIITNTEELKETQPSKSIRVKGFGEANTRFVVTLDSQKVDEGSVGNDGAFEATFDSNMTQNGEYKLEVYLLDEKDNESDKSEPIMLKIDASKPALEISKIPDFIGFENTLISGTTKAGSKVYVIQGNKVIYETASDANGAFDLILRGLKDGANKFVVKVVDIYSNENTQDININFDSTEATKLELLSTKGTKLTFKVPSGIIAIEVYKNGLLIDTLNIDTQEAIYNTEGKGGAVSDKFEFYGIDAAGNKTSPTVYTQKNTFGLIIIVLAVILFVSFVGVIGYMIYKGRIKIPFLKKFKLGNNQIKMDLERDASDNIVPQNIRKEY